MAILIRTWLNELLATRSRHFHRGNLWVQLYPRMKIFLLVPRQASNHQRTKSWGSNSAYGLTYGLISYSDIIVWYYLISDNWLTDIIKSLWTSSTILCLCSSWHHINQLRGFLFYDLLLTPETNFSCSFSWVNGIMYYRNEIKSLWNINISRLCTSNYRGIHTPCPCVFWPDGHNFREMKLKFKIFS